MRGNAVGKRRERAQPVQFLLAKFFHRFPVLCAALLGRLPQLHLYLKRFTRARPVIRDEMPAQCWYDAHLWACASCYFIYAVHLGKYSGVFCKS